MTPELHRPLALDRLGRGLSVTVAADGPECAAIAARMRIPAVHALSCRFELVTGQQGRVRASGALRARVTQTCVVSLEEFEADVTEDFDIAFVPEEMLSDAWDDPESEDELPYTGDTIDLGEAAVEQLALALDPYPRKPGAVLTERTDEVPGALAGLAGWKPRRH